ncbi:hypothetical protein, partial [Aeromonas veronii]|uniref:hypothetical protein n=1 Tax=Aeromonas veronii TaxID=654 RepID=UPI001E284EC4
GDGMKRYAHDADLKRIVVIRSPSPQLVPFKRHRFGKQRRATFKRAATPVVIGQARLFIRIYGRGKQRQQQQKQSHESTCSVGRSSAGLMNGAALYLKNPKSIKAAEVLIFTAIKWVVDGHESRGHKRPTRGGSG